MWNNRYAISKKYLSGPNVGLLSPCGWGNLGDAAIQDAIIGEFRSRFPNARVCGFTLNPADTQSRHGIPAHPIHGFSLKNYGVAQDSPAYSAALRVSERVSRIPIAGALLRFLCNTIAAIVFELRYLRFAVGQLRRLDMIIVSGGGQFDDYWGGAWGHPYALFRWAVLCRCLDKPLVVLSVGVGTIRFRLTRLFLRTVTRFASYRSFRDHKSAQAVGELVANREQPIVPDLAFGIDVPSSIGDVPQTMNRLKVAISPIAFLDPRVWPVKDREAYERYVTVMATFMVELMGAGHHITFFATDGPDRVTIEDVRARIPDAQRWMKAGVLVDSSVGGVGELLQTIAGVDVVVASRLHGVLLSHVVGRPVLAVSYDWKVSHHMEQMGESDWCIRIEDIEVKMLLDTLSALAAQREMSVLRVRGRVRQYREALTAQYDCVFGTPVTGRGDGTAKADSGSDHSIFR